jgi:hypothetical protein
MTQFTNVYAFDQQEVREWPVASGTLAGTPVLSAAKEPAFTITARGDAQVTKTLAGGYSFTYPAGPVGVRTDSAIVATDGSWAGPVTGATSATTRNTPVYFVVADGTLTLTDVDTTTTPFFGVVDSYEGKASATDTTVKIGVVHS